MPEHKDLANALRFLSIDAVERAKSGHPGAPMGMADIATVLWRQFLKHNPKQPQWPNRDRFVLSNGHASMLLYALLHVTGYELSIEDIKSFRQLHSKTPGHPEYGDTPGVETTTGPLGQGLANAVGMALAEKTLAAQFNRAGYEIIDHYTYVFVGDGCLMEGISHEVSALAATWQLGKLIVFYDANGVSIDGAVANWFNEDVAQRYQAYGWHVIDSVDGHDPVAIATAIKAAQQNRTQPTLIICKTIIGFGAPTQQGGHQIHGKPLGDKEINAARKALDWQAEPFTIPPTIAAVWDHRETGAALQQQWQQQFAAYKVEHPTLAEALEQRLAGQLPVTWSQQSDDDIVTWQQQFSDKSMATRQASQYCLTQWGQQINSLLGGSADLTESNNTLWEGCEPIHEDPAGNYVHYGVREFGMFAIMNGAALHGGFIPYGGTFLVFADYARNALRLAAMMQQRVIWVLTHDSIGLGEDGPTHQPIEHLTMLRATPNIHVWRPADIVETAVAWRSALLRQDGPTALVLSRQKLPTLSRTESQVLNIQRGGYILFDSIADNDNGGELPQALILATGSETQIALAAATELVNQGYGIRVVAMPCWEQFEQQDEVYQQTVLPVQVTHRVAIEAAYSGHWYKYVAAATGRVIGIDTFGASAPAADLFAHYKLTQDAVVCAVKEVMQNSV